MTTSRPPTSKIIGYQIGRNMAQREIPSAFNLQAKETLGMLGSGETMYLVPPGIDVLELGLLANPGQFVLLPLNGYNKPLWKETITLLVSDEQARVQSTILERFFDALLTRLPDDADDVEAGVQEASDRKENHEILGLLRLAAIEIWSAERKTTQPLDAAERSRLELAVADRVVTELRDMSPAGRLDRQSLRALESVPIGYLWSFILAQAAAGHHDDATVRALARLVARRNLTMPMRCLLQVLPGVARLDIFFLLLKFASDDRVRALDDWAQRDDLGADPTSAELAVRLLYAIWRIEPDADAAKAMMRAHVPRIQCEPTSGDAQLVKRFLSMTSTLEGSYVASKAEGPLFERMHLAIGRWNRALETKLDEVVLSLPDRVAMSIAE